MLIQLLLVILVGLGVGVLKVGGYLREFMYDVVKLLIGGKVCRAPPEDLAVVDVAVAIAGVAALAATAEPPNKAAVCRALRRLGSRVLIGSPITVDSL